jgi:hypothetical protein
MTAASLVAIGLKLDIVGFMALNAAGYTIGTMLAFIAMIRGPIRVASDNHAATMTAADGELGYSG